MNADFAMPSSLDSYLAKWTIMHAIGLWWYNVYTVYNPVCSRVVSRVCIPQLLNLDTLLTLFPLTVCTFLQLFTVSAVFYVRSVTYFHFIISESGDMMVLVK